ncbi:MAG: inositol-3-phosphate synthase [Elusimicrobia bacterium]|nr:inositol-3-phosphate synthase [Elusimicrobiota bacterium]
MKGKSPLTIAPPTGKVGVLLPGTLRLGKRSEHRFSKIRDFVPLADLKDLVFGGWDIFPDTLAQAARKAGVLDRNLVESLRPTLESLRPWPGVWDGRYVRRLKATHRKQAKTKRASAEALLADIQRFREEQRVDRLVMIWCGSTEVFQTIHPVHRSLKAFELGLEHNDPAISSSQIYAYASLCARVPFANGAPNLTVDIPALQELAARRRVPIAGKDFKTGQTFLKTVIAPALKARVLGLSGWYSTNILGNRDGEVLDDPKAFRTKEVSKLSVLDSILQPALYPTLYRDFCHMVRINYYPPRGDNKEGWDNIDIFGWLGYPMQIKVNFLCRDSILAAPIVLDLALFLDLAQRAGMSGIQEWLSFYFKSPMAAAGIEPEHDLFVQLIKLQNTLRFLMGEEQITHLGIEYYDYYGLPVPRPSARRRLTNRQRVWLEHTS